MEHFSIVHYFECDSTLLVEVPYVTLYRPLLKLAQQHAGRVSDGQDDFIRAFPLSDDSLKFKNFDSDEKKELSVMRMIPVRGSKKFHRQFVVRCELYCHLCYRLQRSAAWILQKRLDNEKHSTASTATACSAFDLDSLSHAVHPLEPTTFLAAAFALPLLLSVSLAFPADAESATHHVRNDASGLLQTVENVPYCFFYAFPERRLFCCDTNASTDGAYCGSEASSAKALAMTLLERVTAVFNALGVCGAVPPVHNTLSVCNRTKIGLTLAAYLEGRLPKFVALGKNDMSSSLNGADLFSHWSDDVLWRLLVSLVSALAVVHTSGFHFRGEISADDVICFALPDGYTNVANSGEFLQKREGLPSVGQRFTEWVEMNQHHWLITETTPAHRVFFMFATLPRSLLYEESQSFLSEYEAQRRDTAAVGRILVTVMRESARRRGVAGSNSCPELLFVAERMAAVCDGDAGVMFIETPAHRFAQLQAVQLRTHIWLLRLIIEERDRQLAATTPTNTDREVSIYNSEKSDYTDKLEAASRLTPQKVSSQLQDKLAIVRLEKRERLVAEREKKLKKFLELYGMTWESLDELFPENDGFERLKEFLAWAISQKTSAETNSETNLSSKVCSLSLEPKSTNSFQQKSACCSTTADTALLKQGRKLQGTRAFLDNSTLENGTSKLCSLLSRPMTSGDNMLNSENQLTDMTPRRWVPHATSAEGVSQRCVNTSSASFFLSYPNSRATNNALSGSRMSTTSGASKTITIRRSQASASIPGCSAFVRPKETSFPAATTTAAELSRSLDKGNVPTRPPSVKQTTRSAAVSENLRRMTPLKKQQGLASVSCNSSRPQSPAVSPPVRNLDNKSSSLHFLNTEKAVSRASLASKSTKLFSSRTIGALHKVLPPRSGCSMAKCALSDQQPQGMSNCHVAKNGSGRSNKTSVNCSLQFTKMRVQSARNDSLRQKNENKDAVVAMSSRVEAVNGTHASLFSSRDCNKVSEKKFQKNDGVQVVNIYCDDGTSLHLNSSSEQNGYTQGDHKSGQSNVGGGLGNGKQCGSTGSFTPLTPATAVTAAEVDNLRQGGSPGTCCGGANDTNCGGASPLRGCNKDAGGQRGQEELATPRVVRQRLVNDGWVSDHLQKLEQLRDAFKSSELTKSGRDTPRAIALFKSGGDVNDARNNITNGNNKGSNHSSNSAKGEARSAGCNWCEDIGVGVE